MLTGNLLVSAVMRELVARMSKSDIHTLVNHKENCQWTVYELRRKYLGYPVDPLKDGKALSKPQLTPKTDEFDLGEDDMDDGDAESIVH